ncbi:NADH-quinone oxidoreductase subunit C [Sphingomonas cavernae]|uniref:NADH-quinone oxidoreductase subunit C n=1 Tax=Sphingomonas cavernae TaxID=2320861 RepID=A0A418W5M2_9SPHN|nr:NADH-quinone oxidoreductase subunit C [Sphingomonas cavernae]RJF85336.1 NADH-quinone oxidoreductase subunit C [Sphingomonas cavernae]
MGSPAPKYATNEGVIDAVRAAIGGAFVDGVEAVGEVAVTVKREALVAVMTALRDKLAYQQLMEIAGVDWPENPERFEVVYCLLSVTKNHRIRVHVWTDEEKPVPSVTGIWPVAGWLEREVYDMYGVLFSGNPDLRRILTDYGFRGHPQRKDFPLTGFVELRYSEEAKRVVYEPVQLAQDFRSFDFMSPWEGAEYVLPGDEKAKLPEAKGAPTPLKADEIKKADAPKTEAKAPPPTPKVTEKKEDTGAGEPANKEAAKKSAGAKKAPPKAKTASTASKPATKKPGATPRGKK